MKIYQIDETQRLAIDIEEAWTFFCNAQNLAEITPPSLHFTITNELPECMHIGMIMTYRLRPWPMLSMQWMTEITHLEPPHLFVDEQRLGPYRFWHHKHYFREIEGGTEMRDVIHYVLPFGPLGQAAHVLAVRKRLDHIFTFRRQAMAERFGILPKGNLS